MAFLSLPVELRVLIYDNLLVNEVPLLISIEEAQYPSHKSPTGAWGGSIAFWTVYEAGSTTPTGQQRKAVPLHFTSLQGNLSRSSPCSIFEEQVRIPQIVRNAQRSRDVPQMHRTSTTTYS